MPYNPATGQFEYGDSYGGNNFGMGFDIFNTQRKDPFDIGIDEEELRKASDTIRQTDKELTKKNRKGDRRQRLIEALPLIAAALTAEDEGDLGRILVQASSMMSEEKQRQKEFEEARRVREQEREARIEEREDIQAHQVGQQESEFGFRRGAQREEFKFRKAERVAENLFELDTRDEDFERGLINKGYDFLVAKELEEIRHVNRLGESASTFEHNAELERRRVSEELATRMESIGEFNPDVARSASDKITSGVPFDELAPIEQAAVKLYTEYNKSTSKQERDIAKLNTMLAISGMEIPIEGAEPVKDIDGRIHVPTRKLNPAEVLPFLFKDPESALRSLIDPSGSPDPFDPASTGETIGEVGRRSIYKTAQRMGTSEEPESQELRQISGMISNDIQAAEFGEELYQNYGLVGARGLLTSLPIDPKYVPLIEKVLEEADALAKDRERMMKEYANSPDGRFNEWNRF